MSWAWRRGGGGGKARAFFGPRLIFPFSSTTSSSTSSTSTSSLSKKNKKLFSQLLLHLHQHGHLPPGRARVHARQGGAGGECLFGVKELQQAGFWNLKKKKKTRLTNENLLLLLPSSSPLPSPLSTFRPSPLFLHPVFRPHRLLLYRRPRRRHARRRRPGKGDDGPGLRRYLCLGPRAPHAVGAVRGEAPRALRHGVRRPPRVRDRARRGRRAILRVQRADRAGGRRDQAQRLGPRRRPVRRL